MSSSARLFNCARCRCQVVICRSCDRGNQYCGAGCARIARTDTLRRAGRRYQRGRQGRFAHADRQRRYRQRQQQKVTHQGSAPVSTGDLLLGRTDGPIPAPQRQWLKQQPANICHFCRCRSVKFLRLGFLRRA